MTANIGEDVGEENPLFTAVQVSAAIKKMGLEGLCDPAIRLQAWTTEVFVHRACCCSSHLAARKWTSLDAHQQMNGE